MAHSKAEKVDLWGSMASLACAVHCAALGLLPGLLGFLSHQSALGPWVEWGFYLSALWLSGRAVWQELQHSGFSWAARLLSLGLLVLTLLRVSHGIEESGWAWLVSVLGGSLVFSGHLVRLSGFGACSPSCAHHHACSNC